MASQISWTKAFRKECQKAHEIIGHSHHWGDRGNAGTSYVRGKNARKEVSKMQRG